MSIHNIISEKLLLPLSDYVTGFYLHKQLPFLLKSQYWTREQIDEYQNKRLRLLIDQAYYHVPFYRELFDDFRLRPEDIQVKSDLQKLPILTKDDFRKNKEKWIADNISKKGLIHTKSSGSTGEPFSYYTTKWAYSFRNATAIRGWYWMGYRLGDKYVKTSVKGRTSFIKRLQDKANSSLFLAFTDYQQEDFRRIIRAIEKYDPQFIRGYPVPLMFLANQMLSDDAKYTGKLIKAINTTGSTLRDNEREIIEKVFGAPVFDAYSCEGSANYSQCPSHAHYHPSEESAIPEFIADSYTEGDAERPLRHITTDLQNLVCPFIRYDTQDYVVLGDDKPCTCGRKFLNLRKLKGRDTDILITPSGKYILMENILGYFEPKYQINQLQVIQEDANKIVFNLVVNNSYDLNTQEEIQHYWQDFIGRDVNVSVKVVDEIKLTPTGKRRTIIRNTNVKLNF